MDGEAYFRFFLALIFVIGMILAIAWVARRFDLGARMSGSGGRNRRLSIIEIMAVDSKRRLVLVRRDDKEHLLLIGGGSDVVIESALPPTPENGPP